MKWMGKEHKREEIRKMKGRKVVKNEDIKEIIYQNILDRCMH
jgi:hypothetical protein